jgi:hypothetical protein
MQAKLPEMFRPILWSYDFDRLDPAKHRKTIVIQAINYGTLDHWHWLTRQYGREGIQQALSIARATEIRPQARRLASLMFGIDDFRSSPSVADVR